MVDFHAAFSGRNILVTGGLGFIGSNLARRLVVLDARVLLVDSLIPGHGGNPFNVHDIQDQVRVNLADTRDTHVMEHLVQDQEIIFNLAGQVSHLDSMRDPQADLEINCRGHLSLLEACRRRNPDVKLVYAGTRQIYGRPQYLPVDETHPLQPVDINGIHKLAAEWYHLIYHRVHGLRAAGLRMTNVYGPRMRVKDARQTFIGWWFRQLVEGQELQVFGTGRQRRDLNYVDDVVEALLLAAADPQADGQVFNLGAAEPIALVELAELLIELNGGGSYRIVPFPAERESIDIGDFVGDHTKIRDRLGWYPRTPLQEGLACTLAFYQRHQEHYW